MSTHQRRTPTSAAPGTAAPRVSTDHAHSDGEDSHASPHPDADRISFGGYPVRHLEGILRYTSAWSSNESPGLCPPLSCLGELL